LTAPEADEKREGGDNLELEECFVSDAADLSNIVRAGGSDHQRSKISGAMIDLIRFRKSIDSGRAAAPHCAIGDEYTGRQTDEDLLREGDFRNCHVRGSVGDEWREYNVAARGY
jgi:hypothetical protein